MEFSESAVKGMKDVILRALKGFRASTDMPPVTDIHILAVRESGSFVVKDDDYELAAAEFQEFAECPEEEFTGLMEDTLRGILQNINETTPLEKLNIWKPFSFVLADEEGETLAELMLFDDDTQLVSQTLMADLDEDLEQFLKNLMLD